jgi:3-phosphoshikimate 1-carboxyvinyltransferase
MYIDIPGSKSHTTRAIILSIFFRETVINRPSMGKDATAGLGMLEQLGFTWVINQDADVLSIQAPASITPQTISFHLEQSGTLARFVFLWFLYLPYKYPNTKTHQWRFQTQGDAGLYKRSVYPIAQTLQQWGVYWGFTHHPLQGDECPVIDSRSLIGGTAYHTPQHHTEESSQWFSALILCMGMAPWNGLHRVASALQLVLKKLCVQPGYVAITMDMLAHIGIHIDASKQVSNIQTDTAYSVVKTPVYLPTHWEYSIPTDISAVVSFVAILVVLQNPETILKLDWIHDSQPDRNMLVYLQNWGLQYRLEAHSHGVYIVGQYMPGTKHIQHTHIDMSDWSDQILHMVVLCTLLNTYTTYITGVFHTESHESNRIASICDQLPWVTKTMWDGKPALCILPAHTQNIDTIQNIHTWKTNNDHRMAFAGALWQAGLPLLGLQRHSVTIDNPACVAKTFPNFWEEWGVVRGC